MFHNYVTHATTTTHRPKLALPLTLFGEEADGLVHASSLGADIPLRMGAHAGHLRLGQRHLATTSGIIIKVSYEPTRHTWRLDQ